MLGVELRALAALASRPVYILQAAQKLSLGVPPPANLRIYMSWHLQCFLYALLNGETS